MSNPNEKELDANFFENKTEKELLDELDEQYKIVDALREEKETLIITNNNLVVTNSNLVKKIEELRECKKYTDSYLEFAAKKELGRLDI